MLFFVLTFILPVLIRAQADNTHAEGASLLLLSLDMNGDRNLTMAEITDVFHESDANQDNSLSQHEMGVVAREYNPTLTMAEEHDLFNLLDVDQNKHVETSDLSEFFHAANVDGDDTVTEAEFFNYWLPKFEALP